MVYGHRNIPFALSDAGDGAGNPRLLWSTPTERGDGLQAHQFSGFTLVMQRDSSNLISASLLNARYRAEMTRMQTYSSLSATGWRLSMSVDG